MIERRVLLVDDDLELASSLAEQLQLHKEFRVNTVHTGQEALDIARHEHFDAILLDVGLPNMDGREVCRLLRREGVKCPILMLTGADTEADTILGLEVGADDYIAKPFRIGELVARLRAQLRQHDRSEDSIFHIGHYVFQPSAKLLIDDNGGNRKIRLTGKESSILKYLYQSQNKPVTREALLHDVLGYSAGISTHTLETHIYRLRQKIEDDPQNAKMLITDHGCYRLVL
jgi:DNA-binding response OmpR family regulator